MKIDLGPDPFEELCAFARGIPPLWAGMTPELVFESWRSRLNATQQELADKSGMVQTQISRLELGFDARVSTWRRLYAAMGFDLFLLPVPRMPLKAIEIQAEEGRPPGSHARLRARPRKRLAGNYKRRQAEKAAAREAKTRRLARLGGAE